MSIREAIIAKANQLGFPLVGVAAPDPPEHISTYQRWIEQGYHGEMAYLASDRALARRATPREILPGCRSILVLGAPYPVPKPVKGKSTPAEKLSGRVASYAWGVDYHDVLLKQIAELAQFIVTSTPPGTTSRWYTDTGPILERDLAQRAGLGWVGKNTCLIHPGMGSYFFLAEIFLDLDLEPDEPFTKDYCGKCRRCIDACPTGCILPERALDARRCISYLTIELKSAIPVELRAFMDDWIFGCDVCQQVCPWNARFASRLGVSLFAPRRGVPTPNLITEMDLSPGAFNEKFRGSPIKRTKRRGYLRNVAVALGNAQVESASGALQRIIKLDPEPLVRSHAAWALGQIGGAGSQEALREALAQESDQEVAAEIHSALTHQSRIQ
jgi:epoxyqueuosine reductase